MISRSSGHSDVLIGGEAMLCLIETLLAFCSARTTIVFFCGMTNSRIAFCYLTKIIRHFFQKTQKG
jgi:hypothetical protein